MISTQAVSAFLSQHPNIKRFCIAYSGGLDSQVLLHALQSACHPLSVDCFAIHIHHGLSPNANAWQQHCAEQCKALSLPMQAVSITLKPSSEESLEAAARDARYAAIAGYIDDVTCLVTAHHQDDQAETFLLQCLRGAGTQGLSAMPVLANFQKGLHWRPFLSFSRDALQAYAIENALSWIEDESNQALRFDRNFLRQQILPELKKRWPSCSKTIARSAKHCADAAESIDYLAKADWQHCSEDNKIHLDLLQALPTKRQNHCLRYWLQQLGLPTPNEKKIQEIKRQAFSAREDSSPMIDWPGAEVRRYRGFLYANPTGKQFAFEKIEWADLSEPLQLNKDIFLKADQVQSGLSFPAGSHITVRSRQGGELMQTHNSDHTKPLKQLFQEANIPPWQRADWPLIYCNESLAAVVGIAIAKPFYDTGLAWAVSKCARAFANSSGVSTDSE